jgi:hypothetical protein
MTVWLEAGHSEPGMTPCLLHDGFSHSVNDEPGLNQPRSGGLRPTAADHECQLWGCEPRPGIRAVAAAYSEASCSFEACTDSSLTDGMAVRWTISAWPDTSAQHDHRQRRRRQSLVLIRLLVSREHRVIS